MCHAIWCGLYSEVKPRQTVVVTYNQVVADGKITYKDKYWNINLWSSSEANCRKYAFILQNIKQKASDL